ncbi:MAG TPA: TadE/TadG family type IV pilus assembly protein [Bryobacteraceae bacterium]|nr:TadE/TadG family type IV pilus assembly protein [Bryobacteraceae bacterium]
MLAKQNQDAKTQGRKKRQRGAALVETALVFTAALSMIVFIVDMGRILLTQQYISERAQAAVRSAVVNNWDSTSVKNYVVYGSTTAPDGGGAGLMGLTTSEVSFNSIADSGIGDARYQVTVSGVPLLTWIPYMAGRYTAPTVIATAPVQSQGATN